MNKYIIRTSDRKTFKECRQEWDFTSKIRQDYEPVKRNINFDFGTAIHAGLEAFHDPGTWHDAVIRTNCAIYMFNQSWSSFRAGYDDSTWNEYATLGKQMLNDYADRKFSYTPIYTEKEFEVPIPVTLKLAIAINAGKHSYFKVYNGDLWLRGWPDSNPVVYQGRIDALVELEGRYYILDHKTARSLSTTEHLEMDAQMKSYCWALQQMLGIKIHGILYDELVKDAPEPPKQLKSGMFSMDKRQNTTVELYKETLDKYGQSVVPYQDFLDYLQANPRQYFRRTEVHYSPKELEIEGERIVLEAMDMLADPAIYPNPNRFVCGRCAFRAPCLALMDGSEADYMLTTNFRKRGDVQDDL